jgi:hypothetical protein
MAVKCFFQVEHTRALWEEMNVHSNWKWWWKERNPYNKMNPRVEKGAGLWAFLLTLFENRNYKLFAIELILQYELMNVASNWKWW